MHRVVGVTCRGLFVDENLQPVSRGDRAVWNGVYSASETAHSNALGGGE